MPALHVRNVPEPLYERLRDRARREGRSINGEAIAILEEALSRPGPREFLRRVLVPPVPRGRVGFFERFTKSARQAVVLAQEEARRLRHRQVGTEHLLLGLLAQPEGVAGLVLVDAGLDLDEVRTRVASVLGEGTETREGQLPFTPAAKEALELALREALELGHTFIGSEHLLLGLLRQPEGVAARVVQDAGLELEAARERIAAAEETAPAYEFRVVHLLEPLQESLNVVGADPEWELVSVLGETGSARAILRRPR